MMFMIIRKNISIAQNTSVKNNLSNDIFSLKDVRENPFELFNKSLMILNILSNKSNLEMKEDFAMEYEMIYRSQLSEI